MKISIISTIFNKEKFLKSHLNSLLEQDYKDIEYIFVNDGSTDKSLDILYQEVKGKKNVIIIDQKNTGQSIARKNGFLRSTGDYIYFVDSDDTLYSKTTISECMKIFMEDSSIDFSVNYMINSYQRKDEIDKIIYSKELEVDKVYSINELYNEVFRNSLCYKIIKRGLIDDECFVDQKIFEDCYFTYAIYSKANKFYYSSTPIYVVNRKTDNISITKSLNVNNFIISYEVLTACKKYENFILSIEKQETKCYLDQLYYSLKLKYFERKKLLCFLKTKRIILRKENIIVANNKKTYKRRYIYQNMITNTIIHFLLVIINKSKQTIRKMVEK